jgi:hypothetical protein
VRGFAEALARSRELYAWGKSDRANLAPLQRGDTLAHLSRAEAASYWLAYSESDRLSSLAARERVARGVAGSVRGREGRRETAY